MWSDMKNYILFGLVFVFASSSYAMTLDQATKLAEENSPELRGMRASVEKASWGKNEAISGYIPHVHLGFDHFLSSKYLRESMILGAGTISTPAAYPQNNFTVDASWTIFDGFGSYHLYRAADLRTESASLDLKHAEFKLSQGIRIAFYQALAAQKLYEVAQLNIKTLEDHLARAKLTAHAGYGTQFDVLRIDANLEEARADLEQSENNIHITRDALFEAMGMAKDDERNLEGELPILSESIVSKVLDFSTSDRDDIRSLDKKREATSEFNAASKNFWYPSVSLFAEQQYYQFGNFDAAVLPTSNYQSASLLGIRLKWNLFDGGYSYAKQQQSSQSLIESQAQSEKAELSMPKDVDTWRRKFNYGVSLYRARLRALAEFQESVRLAEIGVKAGSRTHTEMLDAELDLFRARGGIVKAQSEAIEALSKLELAVGHRIWVGR